ncbi:MAG: prepilin-type N-terminal cleavage/methylation domain-containing protein [Aeromicrobium sp.]|nr:prepilin-type N-terminal cleavage/methylation domain-containing protein [Burkholderiales bacterium]
MKKIQAGFTLIEIIMVIVIIGILAAVAIPRFVDLKSDAYRATAQGFAGALNSANSINVVGCAAKNGVVTANVCSTVAACSGVGALIQPTVTFTVGALPATTVAGSHYLVANTASTATGASCAAVYGDGSAAGTAYTFTATTAP